VLRVHRLAKQVTHSQHFSSKSMQNAYLQQKRLADALLSALFRMFELTVLIVDINLASCVKLFITSYTKDESISGR
jgi:hypothetical protein